MCTITKQTDSDDYSTRRGFLLAGGTALGTLLGGIGYGYVSLQGDDGDYTAPEDFPAISTRGYFDADGDVRDGVDSTDPERRGEWAVDDASALVVYVHGLNAAPEDALNQAHTLRTALETTESPLPVVSYTWDSDRDWAPAKRTADANGPALADWLAQWAAEDGRPIHLVGHSLGARVIGETLVALADGDRTTTLATTTLLGGAIPAGSLRQGERYGDAVAAATPELTNVYSGRDQVLGLFYRAADGTNAVGHVGCHYPVGPPENYRDVDVSETVRDHYSYYEPGDGIVPRLARRFR